MAMAIARSRVSWTVSPVVLGLWLRQEICFGARFRVRAGLRGGR